MTNGAANSSTRSPGCRSTTRRRARPRSSPRTPTTSCATSGADTLVELGSGTSEKTRLLLAASRRRFAHPLRPLRRRPRPFCARPARPSRVEHPRVEVAAVVGDFTQHLGRSRGAAARLIAFLGSTIGNLLPAERAEFPRPVADALEPGEALLLGTDLVKDPARLFAAYNDSAGVTAEFNKNILAVLNRELGADADLDAFAHDAFWDAENEWIDITCALCATRSCTSKRSTSSVPFAAGERCARRSRRSSAARASRRTRRGRAHHDRVVDRPGRRFRAVPLRPLVTLAPPGGPPDCRPPACIWTRAACGQTSMAVQDAVAAHLRHEAELGGYVAQAAAEPVLSAARSALGSLLGFAAEDVVFLESGFGGALGAAALVAAARGGRVGMLDSEWGPNLAAVARPRLDGGPRCPATTTGTSTSARSPRCWPTRRSISSC